MQSANDMDAILDACAKHNVQFMDGTMWLHNPRTAYIAEILHNEALMGPLRTVVCHFHFSGGPCNTLQAAVSQLHQCAVTLQHRPCLHGFVQAVLLSARW